MTVASVNRAMGFAERFGLRLPVLMAPMAGASPPALARAVCEAGGMAAVGALLFEPNALSAWVNEFRVTGGGPLQINLWTPDPAPVRELDHEQAVADFLAGFAAAVDPARVSADLIDFNAQCNALIDAKPQAASSIMGLFSPTYVERLKKAGIAWFACVTTVAEARQAQAAGADVIVAQGAEAGGHRGSFEADGAEQRAVGLFALLPQVVDAVSVPVVATGGIADARGIAAALTLGASAVQIGTGMLRCPEAGIAPAWAAAIATAGADGTRLTRAFSGRWGRALVNDYLTAAQSGPEPAPYPVQRALTAPMRAKATQGDDIRHMQAWSGQAGALAQAEPASLLLARLWREAVSL